MVLQKKVSLEDVLDVEEVSESFGKDATFENSVASLP